MTEIPIKGIRKKFREKLKNKLVRKQKQAELTKIEKEKINEIGFILARKFKYYKLKLACDINKADAEAREVHGYMVRRYPDDYEWLIINYDHIMDRACYFAFQEYQPVIHNLVDKYDLPNMYGNLVILPEKKAHFKTFPMLEFNRIVVYSEGPLEKDLTWIDDYPWTTEDYYRTTITFGPCSFLNMGSPLYDLPILVIKDALGKSKLFFQAKTTAEDLTKQKDEIIKQQIFNLRDKLKNKEEIVEELKMERDGHKRRYDNLKYTMLANAPFMEKEDFKRYERREAKRHQFDRINYKKIAIGILIFIAIIALIVLLTFLFAPKPPTSTEVPEEAGLLISNMFKRGI